MNNFFLKLFLTPGVLFLADIFSPSISFTNPWRIVSVGLFIAVLNFVLDTTLLRRTGTSWLAIIEFVATAVVVYFAPSFVTGVVVTTTGALLSGVLLGISEYCTHRLLLDRELEQTNHQS